MSEEDLARAKEQAKAQVKTICEMMKALDVARRNGKVEYEGCAHDEDTMRTLVEQDALSVEVRSDWHRPGDSGEAGEFSILLCTGGPAVRIIGNLDEFKQPDDALVQYQDWFTLWTDYCDLTEDQENTVLAYCRLYWFGE